MSDDLYDKAVYYVTFDRKASTSYVQRKLQIGYNQAASLMERMEKASIVGPANHVGKRDILLGPPGSVDNPAPEAETPPFDADPPSSLRSGEVAGDSLTEGAQRSEQPQPAPAPKPEPPAPTGPPKKYTCDGCDCEAMGTTDTIPRGWWTQTSGILGTLWKCEPCAAKNASRIATEHMTTEQILNADTSGDHPDVITAAAQGRLKTIIQRVQRLLEDAAAVRGDLKEVFDEAKGEGFDVKIIRKLMAEMQKDPAKREEEQALLGLYASAVGFSL